MWKPDADASSDIAVSRLILGLRPLHHARGRSGRSFPPSVLAGHRTGDDGMGAGLRGACAVVGVPVERLFNQVARLALQGGILIALGLGVYFAIRRYYLGRRGHNRASAIYRFAAAAVIDITMVVSVVTGVLSIGRKVVGVGLIDGWLDGVIALIVVAIFISMPPEEAQVERSAGRCSTLPTPAVTGSR